MGAILFVLALVIYVCKNKSDNEKTENAMRKNDIDLYSYSKSDNFYRQQGKL